MAGGDTPATTRVTRQTRHGPPSPPPARPKRLKRGDATKAENDAPDADPEAELEAWQEFVADHYEMVEQLPLELHRNFRLLRELDDGSLSGYTVLYLGKG